MANKTKKTVKKIAVAAVSMTLAASIGAGPIAASAMQGIDPHLKLGANGGMYYSEFTSNEELLAETKRMNVVAEQEAAILLKNGGGEDGTVNPLPYKDMKRISVFGVASDAYGYGGTGSGSSELQDDGDIYTSWATKGIEINPKLKALYEKHSGGSPSKISQYAQPSYEDKELPQSYYTDALVSTYGRYSDAAVIIINRLGGEGSDLGTHSVQGRLRPDASGKLVQDNSEHYLELSYNEEQLIKHVTECEKFEKVILLLNSGNIIEMGEIQNNPKINAILNIGQTGDYGFDGVIDILTGKVSPSGRTVDIYTTDFTVDPTFKNFGDNSQNGKVKSMGGVPQIEYEEGIYLGYKYYETMYAQIQATDDTKVNLTADATKAVLESDDINGKKNAEGVRPNPYTDADDWYNRNVVYPFGYGLSYANFEWSNFTVNKTGEGENIKFTASVTVTNKSTEFAGKDVVELYLSAPYTKGIERAACQLVTYAKTPLLAPGKSATVTMDFDLYDIAAYDYLDANGNGKVGYEIDAGTYVFSARKDSHTSVLTADVTLEAATEIKHPATKTPITNVFVDSADAAAHYNYASISPTMTVMSRKDMIGTFPKAPTADDYDATKNPTTDNKILEGKNDNLKINKKEVVDKYNWGFVFGGDDDTHELWAAAAVIPETWTQAADDKGEVKYRLTDMMGLDPYDTTTTLTEDDTDVADFVGKTPAKAWEMFMNQLTYKEMQALTRTGFFKTVELARFGKEEAVDADGPCTIGNQTKDGYQHQRGRSGTRYWVSSQNLAMTYNVDLVYRIGKLIGEEGMWNGYNGWYAPSMDIHRSPFSGRNFEYFSQDGVQGGLIVAALLQGTNQGGVYPYCKHFALNDQETARNNSSIWADEQTIRENYLRNFEYAVVDGGATGIMTGFNRIGMANNTEHYGLQTIILRNEWGFNGSVVTDYRVGSVGNTNNNLEVFLRAGVNIPLGDMGTTGDGVWDATLRGGNGGVKVGKFDKTTKKYSTTEFISMDSTVVAEKKQAEIQYYYMRTRALDMLYTHARSNAMDNGADFLKNLKAEGIKIPVGATSEKTVSIAFENMNRVDVELVASKLPTGVTFNANTLTFTANSRTTVVGEKGEVTLKVSYDNWANKRIKVPVEIVPAATIKGETTIAKGTAYEATVSRDWQLDDVGAPKDHDVGWGNIVHGWERNGIGAASVSVEGLPTGLTFNAETGKITGTPTEAGEKEVTITTTMKIQAEVPVWGTWTQLQVKEVKVQTKVMFTVGDLVTVTVDGVAQKVEKGTVMTAPEAPKAPAGMQFDGWYNGETKFDFTQPVNGDVTLTAKFVPIPDEIEFRVTEDGKIQASINGGEWVDVIDKEEIKGDKGDTGETGAPGEKGDKGDTGAPGKDGKDAEGGCGSSIGVGGAVTLMAALAAIGGFVIVRRASKKQD